MLRISVNSFPHFPPLAGKAGRVLNWKLRIGQNFYCQLRNDTFPNLSLRSTNLQSLLIVYLYFKNELKVLFTHNWEIIKHSPENRHSSSSIWTPVVVIGQNMRIGKVIRMGYDVSSFFGILQFLFITLSLKTKHNLLYELKRENPFHRQYL